MRRGWTLHEMLISMVVAAGVVGVAVQVATAQLRFFRRVGEMAMLRGQLGPTTAIVTSLLVDASPVAGDIVVAGDSALELDAAVGAAVVCESDPGRITVPAPTSARGNALAAYAAAPAPDDRVSALFADSIAETWLAFRVASAPVAGAACPRFPAVASTWLLGLREPLTIPPGTPVRFTRPMRLSLYRASDGRWYLGARDWNGEMGRFNGIQPAAGPLRPYSVDGAVSGLVFRYYDASGAELSPVTDTRRVASVRVTAHGISVRQVRSSAVTGSPVGSLADSLGALIALRNAR